MKSNNSCMFVANIVVNPYICKPVNTPRYITLYIFYHIDIKINISWNRLHFNYGVRVIVPRLANEKNQLNHFLKRKI